MLRYVEAAQDPNPLHRDPDAARAAGFPGPILPGMLLLGLCERAVETWRGNWTILHLAGRFLTPLAAPAEVEITAGGGSVEALIGSGRVRVDGRASEVSAESIDGNIELTGQAEVGRLRTASGIVVRARMRRIPSCKSAGNRSRGPVTPRRET